MGELFLIFTTVITPHNCLAFSSCPHLSLFHWMCSWKWFKGHVEFEGFDLYCHFAFQTFVLLSIPSTSQKLLTVLCKALPPWAFPWLPAAYSLCTHPGPLSSPLLSLEWAKLVLSQPGVPVFLMLFLLFFWRLASEATSASTVAIRTSCSFPSQLLLKSAL